MNYNSLKATINANIKQNGNQEITGVVLNSVLNAMVNALASAGATFGGVIDPTSSAPGSLNQATIYLALTPGEYPNFLDEDSEPIVVDGIALIQYDGGDTLEFSKTELKPWQMTIVPDVGNTYIGIFVPNGGCTLAVDSVGFHGMICITNAYGISSATFVGSGGIDTSVNVESGRANTTPVVVLKSNNDTPITITCVAGNAPDRAFGTDEIIITPIATKAWTELGAGGGDGKYGVISQVQTWSGSGSNPRSYTIDPASIVRGIIPQANIDLFVAAGATFNSVSGYFELNGLTDISYEEMRVVYNLKGVADAGISGSGIYRNINPTPRTLPPISNRNAGSFLNGFRVNTTGSEASDIEAIGIGTSQDARLYATSLEQLIYGCEKIRHVGVNGSLAPTASASLNLLANRAYSLETFKIVGLAKNIGFTQSPNLTPASVAYMINNAGTATITITLHATAYARANADADVQAALAAHTNVSLASV